MFYRKVLPIFYKVMTSNVKQLKGDFGKHFWDQERKCKASRMKKWKKALEFVSGNIGLRWDTERYDLIFFLLLAYTYPRNVRQFVQIHIFFSRELMEYV